MIYHSILVTPKQEARSIIPHPTAYNGRLTQDELNTLIKDSGFSVGMFITSTKSKITFITQIEYIIGVQHNAEKVNYRYQNRDPLWLFVMSIPRADMPNINPWIRNDCETGYRQITVPEFENLILPVNDFVQNRIKLGEEKFARDFPSSAK